MGRSGRQLVGRYYLRKDKGDPGRTPEQLILFAEKSPGPVAEQLLQLELVGFDADGNYKLQPAKVKSAVEQYKDRLTLIEERGAYYILDEYREDLKGEGVSESQLRRAVNREVQAEAKAIVAAVRATKQKLTPYQERILAPALDGRYLQYAEDQFRSQERQALAKRLKTSKGRRYRDPAFQARAQELIERGREAGFGGRATRAKYGEDSSLGNLEVIRRMASAPAS